MNVLVDFYVFDLPPNFPSAELELRGGATVNDVIDACLELFKNRQVSMDENELRTATVMVGNKWLNLEDSVNDGDEIKIIRPMDGG